MKRMLSLFCSCCVCLCIALSMPLTTSAAGMGDYNYDGVIDTSDVRQMLTAALKSEPAAAQQLWVADYDRDDAIDTSDARRVLTQAMESRQTIDYAGVTTTDAFSEKTVAVLGGSHSYGTGCAGFVAEDSYVGIVKKAINAKNGSTNYGFTSVAGQTWEADVAIRSFEIHKFPSFTTSSWTEDDDCNRLGIYGLSITAAWTSMVFTLRDEYADAYDYFCVYYHAKPDGGTFCIADGSGGEVADINGSKAYINTDSETQQTLRTAFYRLSDCPTGEIRICAGSNVTPQNTVTITGIGYYNDISGEAVTVQNYSRGGLTLSGSASNPKSGTSYAVLDQVMQSETVLFALGYNDSHFPSSADNDVFSAKIDFLIEKAKEYGTKLIVNDMSWYIEDYDGTITMDLEQINFVKSELKRLAAATDAIYIDQQAYYGDAVLSTVYDGAHFTAEGHRMIADAILEAIGLA